jgi:hypothetical protein
MQRSAGDISSWAIGGCCDTPSGFPESLAPGDIVDLVAQRLGIPREDQIPTESMIHVVHAFDTESLHVEAIHDGSRRPPDDANQHAPKPLAVRDGGPSSVLARTERNGATQTRGGRMVSRCLRKVATNNSGFLMLRKLAVIASATAVVKMIYEGW